VYGWTYKTRPKHFNMSLYHFIYVCSMSMLSFYVTSIRRNLDEVWCCLYLSPLLFNCHIVSCISFLLVYNHMWWCSILKYLFTWIHVAISYLGSKRESASLSPWVSLCGGMMDVRQQWNGTIVTGGAPMVWCSGYGGGKM
jgi:hypothetical protein